MYLYILRRYKFGYIWPRVPSLTVHHPVPPFPCPPFSTLLHLLNIPPGDLVLLQGGIDAANEFAKVIHRDDAIDEQFLGGEHGFGQKHSLIPLGS
jgi:hypothetical protein